MFKAVAAFSGFSVKDQEEAKKFYTEVLGLELKDDQMGLTFKLPGGGEVFIYPKADHQSATYTNLNFVVEDIDDAVKELKDKGIAFEHYEGLTGEDGIARGKSQDKGPDIAWFKDPSGNILSVLQD